MVSIGQRIRHRRTVLGISPDKLAADAKIPKGTLDGWELYGKTPRDLDGLCNVAVALHCDLNWLVTGKGNPPPPPDTTRTILARSRKSVKRASYG